MSSFSATSKRKNITTIKETAQNVAKNLELMESFATGNANWNDASIKKIKNKTNNLLRQLAAIPATKVNKIIEKRQKQRKQRKLKQKLLKCAKKQQQVATKKSLQITSTIAATAAATATTTSTKPTTDEDSVSSAPAQTTIDANATVADNFQSQKLKLPPKIKLHHQLRYQQEGQRFLRTFELLKILHFARGQNKTETHDFNAKFDHLRANWHRILAENVPNTTRRQQKIEHQWEEVFFGVKERLYYSNEQKLSDFLRIRRTWDTYLTRSKKYGTSIPNGWVLPKEEHIVDVRWLKYKKNENIQ